MSKLFKEMPKNWATAEISECLLHMPDGRQIHQGWSPQCENDARQDESEWACIKTTAIQPGVFLPAYNKKLPGHLEPRPVLEIAHNDLLLTCAGPRNRCGITCLVKNPPHKLMISGKMYRFRVPERELLPEFLEAYLRSPHALSEIDSIKTGANDSGLNLTQERFLKLQIPIAPIREQQRIVAKLESLFERCRSIREKLDRLPRLLANLQKSILDSALNDEEADAWDEVPLIDLCATDRSLTYGIIKLGDHIDDGVPVLRSSNVRHLYLELDGMKKVSHALSDEYSRTILKGNEVVVTVRGTLGGVSAVSPQQVGWNVSREVAVIPLRKEINPEFVALSIGSPKSQAWLRGSYKGVAYTGINIADLKLLRIRLPKRSKQDEIVQRFQVAQNALKNLALSAERGINRIDNLYASLLSKAFRGELVPQDPNDEPAFVLLERIRAQKPVAGTKRGRRKAAT